MALFCTTGSAVAQPAQDYRNPDNRVQTSGGGGAPSQDLRSPDARDAATPKLPGPPTWPVNPEPIAPAPAAESTAADGGIDWLAMGLGLGAGVLVCGAAVALVARSRRPGRVRVQA